ncbi:guanine deaminase [Arhodomonas sp. SL1]|uniref:guanine deaminase n=1 Tax=Arhodomonas sp. SL1 TaxID=3425691 RepID=UPI003F884764
MTEQTEVRRRAFRGCIVYCRHDPGEGNDPEALEVHEDGVLVVADGRVEAEGPAAQLLPTLGPETEISDQRGRLIIPGMVDCHIHFAQTDIIASYGEQLLTWLERYTFPVEGRFGDAELASETAEFFLDELLRNGTTSALVLGTVHAVSAEAVLDAAHRRGMRLSAGKVLMDRNAPDYLRDTAETGYRDSRALIERWHGVDRLAYAITPRFAPTSSDEQLRRVGELARAYPDTYVHTHVAENPAEVAWVSELFPWSRSYLDVYDRFGMLRERSVYAHCIHLDDGDRRRMAETGAVMGFCPTSNLFLGSGLFDYAAARDAGVGVGLATDVGGGTSFSMLRTAAEAYKVAQLQGTSLSAARLLYLVTLAGAEALSVADRIGGFRPGREADLVVLDPAATPLLARRSAAAGDITERLFALLTLGDDRCIAETWVAGRCLHRRGADSGAGG